MRRRALLLSGGVNQKLDHPWYANDIAAYYRLLVETYHYREDEIRVCMAAGGARQFIGGKLIQVLPARRPQVLEALAWLAELGEGDLAFLMVTDHGLPGGISLWGKGQLLRPMDLAPNIGQSAATKVLVLGQCFGADFIVAPLRRAVLCCASEKESHHRPRVNGVEPSHSEFLYRFAGALAGRYPDGAPLPQDDDPLPAPGTITIQQAFEHARAYDHWITGTRQVSELPRIFDVEGIAATLTL